MKPLFALLLLFNICFAHAQIADEPHWIKKLEIDFSENNIPDHSGGYYYHLIDVQDHLKTEQRYIHYGIQIINSDGIQSMSDISVNHDPSYQTLNFHKVIVHRNGQKIDKLKDHRIHTYQRETNMERNLYDGSLTYVINLSDIREGDIIEYSYSRTGYNPLYKNQYFERFYLEYNLPINHIYNSITTRKQRKLDFKYYHNAPEPETAERADEITYFWDEKNVKAILYDNNVPAWHDEQKSVAISSFRSWQEVVNWALPLYNLDQKAIESIKKKTAEIFNTTDKNLQIVKAIEFVQDEIRYLGFESGLSAYQPNQPDIVLDRRFGDCKDKSLLLVAILRSIGVDASPVLISSGRTFAIESDLPSPSSFDHCVVQFNYQNKEVFIDPTMNNQGGSWDMRYFPEYQKGLIIKKGTNSLAGLPSADYSKVIIKELISAQNFDESAQFLVRTEYYGNKADLQRSYFKNARRESITKDYQDYYSSLYPEIRSAKEVNFLDYDRHSINKIIVEEAYEVDNFWQKSSENPDIIFTEIYPLVLESLINTPKSAERKMPYYLGPPHSFVQETTIELPDDWSVENKGLNFNTGAFSYSSSTNTGKKTLSANYEYQILKSFIPANEVKDFLASHEKIRNDLSLTLSRDRSIETFRMSWLSFAIVLLVSGLGIFFAIKIYREFNPPPQEALEKHDQIGGWLILVAIGLVLTPVFILRDLIGSTEYFNHNVWLVLMKSNNADNGVSIAILIFFELVYNCLFFIFAILVLISFFQRRSSLPRLIIIFYGINLVAMVVDTSLALGLMPDQYTEEEKNEFYRSILKSIIAASIWIPYFFKSERVKSTFTETYKSNENLELQASAEER